jgi:dihydroflavonol-4-reductase
MEMAASSQAPQVMAASPQAPQVMAASPQAPQAPLVLVTGVSGFIASWTAYYLLQAGFRVRGTVRSLPAARASFLATLAPPGCSHALELCEADLLGPAASWGAAVAGCAYVLHIASPFVLEEPSDAQALIRPAVEGTLAVLRACGAAQERPRRVVVTSSVAAVAYGHGATRSAAHVFTEGDFTNAQGPQVGAYIASKALAEAAAWEYVRGLPQAQALELATVNPVFVLGPTLAGASASGSLELIQKFFTSPIPGFPAMPFNFVDVRDVALLHVAAMLRPGAAGRRFIASGCDATLDALGPPLKAALKPLGFATVCGTLPRWLLSAASLFDRDARLALRNIGSPKRVSAAAGEALVGGGFRFAGDAGEMAVLLARSLIAAGKVRDVSRGAALSTGRSEAEKAAAKHPPPHPLLLPLFGLGAAAAQEGAQGAPSS